MAPGRPDSLPSAVNRPPSASLPQSSSQGGQGTASRRGRQGPGVEPVDSSSMPGQRVALPGVGQADRAPSSGSTPSGTQGDLNPRPLPPSQSDLPRSRKNPTPAQRTPQQRQGRGRSSDPRPRYHPQHHHRPQQQHQQTTSYHGTTSSPHLPPQIGSAGGRQDPAAVPRNPTRPAYVAVPFAATMATPLGPPAQSSPMLGLSQPSEQYGAHRQSSPGGRQGESHQTTYRLGEVETGLRPDAAPMAYSSGPTPSGLTPYAAAPESSLASSATGVPIPAYPETRSTQPAAPAAPQDVIQHTTNDIGASYGSRLPSQGFLTANTFPGPPSEQVPAYYGFATYPPYPAYFANATPGNAGMAPQIQQLQATGMSVPQTLMHGQQYPSYYSEGQLHQGYGVVQPAPADYASWQPGGNVAYGDSANVMGHHRQASGTEDSLHPSLGGQVPNQMPYTSTLSSGTSPHLQHTMTMRPQRRASTLSTSARRSEHRSTDPRSEHVMWVGNVPADATQEELWSIFSTLPPVPSQDPEREHDRWPHGILSIFIIARSNCAFVNYTTPDYLTRAVEFFHGKSLRPHDARCPKLVCRIRKKDEEAAAGVAGQRGKGVHVAWLKEHNRRLEASRRSNPASSSQSPTTSTSAGQSTGGLALPHERLLPESGSAEASSGTATPRSSTCSPPTGQSANFERTASDQTQSASDPSYASTNSDVLSHPAFSKRYFHLKSHDVEDLDRAVKTNIWSTQPHNEPFLDQAFRHSEVVYLFFSANQSGRFYGYGKMTSAIASDVKEQESPSSGSSRPSVGALPPSSGLVKESPLVMTPAEESETPASDVKTPAEQTERPAGEAEQALSQTWSIGPEAPARKTSSADGVGDESVGSSAHGGVVYSDSSKNHRLRTRDRQVSNSGQPETSPTAKVQSTSGPSEQVVPTMDTVSPKLSDRRPSSDAPSSSSRSAEFLDDVDRALDFPSSPSKESRAADQQITRSLIHNLRLDQIDSQEKVKRLQRTLDDADRQLLDTPGEGEGQMRSSTSPTSPASPQSVAHPFGIEWLQTVPLPFGVVKHLRNPWNENKSVRVGRDGTEIAVETGAELLRIWDDYARKHEGSSSR